MTVVCCAVAFGLGTLALLAWTRDIDEELPSTDGDGLAWFLTAVALVTFVASGPAGDLIARNRVLLWAPAVVLAVPLAAWGVFGMAN